jgi:hypothetical protein
MLDKRQKPARIRDSNTYQSTRRMKMAYTKEEVIKLEEAVKAKFDELENRANENERLLSLALSRLENEESLASKKQNRF